jgi:hypothetical protein
MQVRSKETSKTIELVVMIGEYPLEIEINR